MDDFQPVQTLITKTKGGDNLQRWMRGFIVDRKTQNVSPSTIKFYGVEFRRFSAYCEERGVMSVLEITPDLLRFYLLHLEQTGRNPGGVNAGYRAIKSFLIWFENETEPVSWQNPIRKVKTPKVDILPLEPVGLDTVQKLINTCEGDSLYALRDKALFMCLLDTGARAFELCAMNLEDMDMLQGDITIRHGKGAKPRIVCVGKKTRKAIRAYLKTRRDNAEALWVGADGTRLTYWGVNQILRRRAKAAGISKPGLHDFRRAFALNCLRGGMDVYSLQKLMGHADLQVLRRYLAQTDEDIRVAFSKASPVDNGL